MDKSWMHSIKWSKPYIEGVNNFMRFVETHMAQKQDIRCPCRDCLNLVIRDKITVKKHILERGIDPGYVTWFYHGEPNLINNLNQQSKEDGNIDGDSLEENDDEDDGVTDMLFDLGEQYWQTQTNNMSACDYTNTCDIPAYLESLLMDAKTELYPGCKKISKTSFIIQLLHLKVYNRLSNKTIDMMLKLMKLAFPDGETLPSSCYEAKKFLRELGLGYECIHACKFDCVLFWKENKSLDTCPTCGTSRWKINDGTGKKMPQKILRYFPLTPRLQRLFMSSKTSKKMVWHQEKRIDDDYMRHPADSVAWKSFDNEFPSFANDPRNVRLALAADGFNPFGNLSTTYSMWPVILAPLNLPPWDCMKQPFFMLSLLIPGKKSHCSEKDCSVNDGWKSIEAKQKWELMIKKREEYREQGIEKSSEEIVFEVLGPGTGYIKGLGYGPKPPSRRNILNDSTKQQLQKELQETQQKLQQSEAEVNDLKIEMTDLKGQMTQQGANINKLMAFLADKGLDI